MLGLRTHTPIASHNCLKILWIWKHHVLSFPLVLWLMVGVWTIDSEDIRIPMILSILKVTNIITSKDPWKQVQPTKPLKKAHLTPRLQITQSLGVGVYGVEWNHFLVLQELERQISNWQMNKHGEFQKLLVINDFPRLMISSRHSALDSKNQPPLGKIPDDPFYNRFRNNSFHNQSTSIDIKQLHLLPQFQLGESNHQI